jgi:hypothetical protein
LVDYMSQGPVVAMVKIWSPMWNQPANIPFYLL